MSLRIVQMTDHINLRLNPVMQSQTSTIPVALVQSLLSGVRARGEACDRFLSEAEIPMEIIEQASARVTTVQYATLFRSLIERRQDEGLGFLSRPLKLGSLALMARSALGAPDLETAIRRISHVCRLLQDDVLLELRHEGDLAALTFRVTDSSAPQSIFFHFYLQRVFWILAAWLTGGKLPAVRFDFAFEAPPHVSSYDRVFPAQLAFGCEQSAVWIRASRLRGLVQRDEAALRIFLSDAQTNIILPNRNKETTGHKVRRYLQEQRSAWPGLCETAQALNMSTATLQRRLTAEGTSFQALKDELRRDVAVFRLHATAVPLMQLAQDLGFSDSAAFQRAFKGWTGSAPGAYRKLRKDVAAQALGV